MIKKLFLIVGLLYILLNPSVYSENFTDNFIREMKKSSAEINKDDIFDSLVLISGLYMSGSGIVVHENGFIITSKHLVNIDNYETLKITLYGDETPYHIEWAYPFEIMDITLLKINPEKKLKPIKWGDSNKVSLGDTIFSLGHPRNYKWLLSKGIISGKRQSSLGVEAFVIDASVHPGASGGALLNEDFEFIGTIWGGEAFGSMYNYTFVNINFALCSNIIKILSDGLIKAYLYLEKVGIGN